MSTDRLSGSSQLYSVVIPVTEHMTSKHMKRARERTLTSGATSFRVGKRKYVAMHVAKMHEIHIAVMQVAVRVAKAAEQGGQKCEALSRPMLSDPETGCPNDAARVGGKTLRAAKQSI